jgi:hypothetical protein
MIAVSTSAASNGAIHSPTSSHRSGDRMIGVENGRWLRQHPRRRQFELSGDDHPGGSATDALLDDWSASSARCPRSPDRVLATALFTDVVDSSARRRARRLRWRDLMARHEASSATGLRLPRPPEVKTIGDGFASTFDGPRAPMLRRCVRDAVPAGARATPRPHTERSRWSTTTCTASPWRSPRASHRSRFR